VTSTIKNIGNIDGNIMDSNEWNQGPGKSINWTLYWVSDNPEISRAVERKSYKSLITLKPGQECHPRIELVAHSHPAKGTIFRLGYDPNAFRSDNESRKDIIWSDAVTLPALE
jgi:hypothetical protein